VTDEPLDPNPQTFWTMCANLQAFAEAGQLDQLDIRVTFFAGRWAVSVDDGDSVRAATGATLGEAYERYTQALP
jgi:hypothetical protein